MDGCILVVGSRYAASYKASSLHTMPDKNSQCMKR